MEDVIYQKLRERLDRLGPGYPKTEDGKEYVFLRRFYSPKDAETILNMSDGYQTAADYASTAGVPVKEAETQLYDMSKRGLIYREKCDGVYRYHLVPLVHGTYEFNINNFDNAWLTPFFQTLGTPGFREQMYANKHTPFFRAIPGSKQLVKGGAAGPYDDIEAILARESAFALSPCACRTNPKFRGVASCDHPTDTCLLLGGFADYAVENGFGHYVSRDEALKMLQDGLDDDRVIQVINSKQSEVICSCCSCSCGVLRGRKQFGNMELWSNYYAVRDEDRCTRCGTCEKHCQVGAITVDGIDLSHCIGCGLCVQNCPAGALELVQKETAYEPPETLFDSYSQMTDDLRYVKVCMKWQPSD